MCAFIFFLQFSDSGNLIDDCNRTFVQATHWNKLVLTLKTNALNLTIVYRNTLLLSVPGSDSSGKCERWRLWVKRSTRPGSSSPSNSCSSLTQLWRAARSEAQSATTSLCSSRTAEVITPRKCSSNTTKTSE